MIKEIIVVEGSSDTSKLRSIFGDIDTIETNGSEISEETINRILLANDKRGVIIFTDPDYSGNRIRKILQDRLGNCKHAYVRKEFAISKNKVGIAECLVDEIKNALDKVVTYNNENDKISWEEYIQTPLMFDTTLRKRISDDLQIGKVNNKQLFKCLKMLGFDYLKIMEIIRRVDYEKRYINIFKNDRDIK